MNVRKRNAGWEVSAGSKTRGEKYDQAGGAHTRVIQMTDPDRLEGARESGWCEKDGILSPPGILLTYARAEGREWLAGMCI